MTSLREKAGLTEAQLRREIRQAIEESLHHAREAQRLEGILFRLQKAKAQRRRALETVAAQG